MRSKVGFRFSGFACILAALMLLMLPLSWLLAAAAAAAFHELCHMAAIKLCGGEILGIQFGADGATIEFLPMGRGRELLCALAGPAGGLFLLLFAKWIPRTAVCAAFHSIYNLLPIYPMDGGRALHCAATMILPPNTAGSVCTWVQAICCGGILVLGLWSTFVLGLGVLPLLVSVFVLIKTNSVKCPCKQEPQRVQ